MREQTLQADISLRRNYQDLRFCPQNIPADLKESRRRSREALTGLYPDMETLEGAAMGSLPYLFEALLPRDYHKAGDACLLAQPEGRLYAAINLDEHLVLSARGEPAEMDSLLAEVRGAEKGLADSGLLFASDPDFGYLSYRPALSGSGLYVSLVLHLPMLAYLKQMKVLAEELHQRGCILRPVTGRDGRNPGKLFVLSNAASYRKADEDILEAVRDCTRMLSRKEAAMQEKALSGNGHSTFADQAWRSLGILSHARRLSALDFLTHWSNLRLGALAGILPTGLEATDSLLRYANDHPFLREGGDPKLTVVLRAQTVRQALSGG